MQKIAVGLLGPFEVRRDGEPVTAFQYAKVRALLAYLAVEAGRPHTRAHLATLLWPDQPERKARASLSQALATLRRALEDPAAGLPLLLADVETVQFAPDHSIQVDAAQFVDALRASEAHAHRSWRTCTPCAGRLEQALSLYRGDFLAGFFIADSEVFEEWAAAQREYLRQRALSALERLAAWAEWRGQYERGVEYARRLAELEPLLEANHRWLMRLLALSGQRRAALAQYEAMRRILAQELNATPDAESAELRAVIEVGAETGAALRGVPPAPGGLPASATPLIGRAGDLHRICEQLRNDARLVTLTGAPGVGKTRLALQAAQELRFDFEDGVHVVELAALDDPALAPVSIARALGIRDQPRQGPAATLSAALRRRHMLLVLDNFEHLLAAAGTSEAGPAAFVAELLAACPGVKALITSRAPLRLRAEQAHPLAPLAEAEAVELFVARARAARGGQPVRAGNEAVAELCRRLDGLPLAIELIAARARTLSVAELRELLAQGIGAAAHGPRDAPERHRTLRAAIAWSVNLLSAPEQRVFAHLGVFAGGCTAEAAQAVAGPDGKTAGAALEALEALAEASLITAHAAADETRFGLLETVREFALEQLEARDEAAAARRLHLDYYLALAERALPELEGPAQRQWFDRLEREHDNVRAALAHAQALEDDSALRLAAALGSFWEVRGYLSEGRHWLRAALAARPRAPLPLRAAAMQKAGGLAYRQGDYESARALCQEALVLWQRLEEGPAIAQTLRRLGAVAYDLGDTPAAKAYQEQSLAIAREIGDARSTASALNSLALATAAEGDDERARGLYEECLAITRELGDQAMTGMTLLNLGLLAEHELDFGEARALLEESLAAFREIGHKWGIGLAQLNLGNMARSQADHALAEPHFQESLAIFRELGDQATASYPLFGLGEVALGNDDAGAARTLFRESLALRHETGENRPIPRNLEGLAQLERAGGRPERAARLFGAAEALREAQGAVINPPYLAEWQNEIAALQAALGTADFAAAWAEGRALTLEQAVALALEAGRPGEAV